MGLRREDAAEYPKPSMGLLPDSKADKQSEEDRNHTRRHVHQCSLFGFIPQVANQSCRVGRDDTAGDRQLVGVSIELESVSMRTDQNNR